MTRLAGPSLLYALLALAAIGASPASAAKVSAKDADTFGSVRYTAGPGEANDVVFKLRRRSVAVTDRGARIRAGKGCKRRGATIECAMARATVITHTVKLGDGADRTRVRRGRKAKGRATFNVDGGDGDDVLDGRGATHPTSFFEGGAGDDSIIGSRDGDVIRGGPGRDRLDGRGGGDQLRPDGAAAAEDDVLIGGDGSDTAIYEGRANPVTIDLRRASPQGSAGESDSFDGIENASGTAGDDVLLGNASANDLLGGAGSDEIRGFEGNDRVWGEDEDKPDVLDAGPGRDIVNSDAAGSAGEGGDGDDQLYGRGTLDGGAGRDYFEPDGASVLCGADDDQIKIHSTAPAALDASCEDADFGREGFLQLTLPIKRQDGGLVATLGCGEDDTGEIDTSICSGDITAKIGENVIASGEYSGTAGQRQVQMPYSPGGREALGSEPRQVRVTIGKFTIDVVV